MIKFYITLLLAITLTGCNAIKTPSIFTTDNAVKAIDIQQKYKTSLAYWTKVKTEFDITSVNDKLDRIQLENAGAAIDKAFSHVAIVVYGSNDLKDKAVVIAGYASTYKEGTIAVSNMRSIYNRYKDDLPEKTKAYYDGLFDEFEALEESVSTINASEGIIKWVDLLATASDLVKIVKQF